MIRRTTVLAIVTAAGFAIAAPNSAIAGALDQSQPNAMANYEPVGGNNGAAQTFTAGLSGPLDQVDLSINAMSCTPDLVVELRTVDSGGHPTGTIRAVTAVSRGNVPSFNGGSPPAGLTPATFSSPASVTAGAQYAIVLPGVGTNTCYAWYLETGDPYPGGMGFFSATESFTSLPSYDFSFQTYVQQPSPPATTVPSTGQRAAALMKCKKTANKKNWTKKRLRKCKKKAGLLPL
jgi:hypothetical protein